MDERMVGDVVDLWDNDEDLEDCKLFGFGVVTMPSSTLDVDLQSEGLDFN